MSSVPNSSDEGNADSDEDNGSDDGKDGETMYENRRGLLNKCGYIYNEQQDLSRKSKIS